MPALALPCPALKSPAFVIGQRRAQGSGIDSEKPEPGALSRAFSTIVILRFLWMKDPIFLSWKFQSELLSIGAAGDSEIPNTITKPGPKPLPCPALPAIRAQGSGIDPGDALPYAALPCPVNTRPCPARPNTTRDVEDSVGDCAEWWRWSCGGVPCGNVTPTSPCGLTLPATRLEITSVNGPNSFSATEAGQQ
ncbi:hypothetical protein C8J56DRAFT_891320 [Mycena floridula]|nr:hypothetical protein C8J56DRAFT_891320 [Mycena floridula]